MGWKDILRPIRDGFRDNLPSKKPSDDQEAEKRRQRRERDALKGFTYFESFEDIDAWDPDNNVMSLQRANTPLLPRAETDGGENKAALTIIHDFSGNYHDYEAVQGSSLDRETYSCEYMQFVDSFVYFSHKLVCVPPPSWTNALHRNGVKSLGTFLVEPQSSNISQILQKRVSKERGVWEYVFASKLTEIARFHGFDGWLLNIEKTFPIADWRRDDLVGFIRQLKSSFEHGCVIWYDALTKNNTINYQNGLTLQNLPFAQAAGSMLTNYAWDPSKARESKDLALRSGISPQDISCGIDVWAQNSGDEWQARKTYPRDEGGGTGTGLGVAKLAELGLSAGVFAPAWPYEHFPSCSKAVERSMWTGEPLPESMNCDCIPAHRHDIQGYRKHSILKYAREYPAGSETFFYTDFRRAFQGVGNEEGDHRDQRLTANIGSQSILPLFARPDPQSNVEDKSILVGQLHDGPPRAVVCMHGSLQTRVRESLRLFNLRMKGNLTTRITYQKPDTPEELQIWLQIEGTDTKLLLSSKACTRTVVNLDLDCQVQQGYITGISIEVQGDLSKVKNVSTLCIVEILEISIQPRKGRKPEYKIYEVVLDERDKRHSRLCWKFGSVGASGADGEQGMPNSRVTGSFSFFTIMIGGQEMGRAYSVDFLISKGVLEEQDIQIAGYGFDGEIICSYAGKVNETEHRESVDSWDLI